MISTNIDRKLTWNGFLIENGMYIFDKIECGILVQVKIYKDKAVTIYSDCIEEVSKVVEYPLLDVADETVRITKELLNNYITIGEIE